MEYEYADNYQSVLLRFFEHGSAGGNYSASEQSESGGWNDKR